MAAKVDQGLSGRTVGQVKLIAIGPQWLRGVQAQGKGFVGLKVVRVHAAFVNRRGMVSVHANRVSPSCPAGTESSRTPVVIEAAPLELVGADVRSAAARLAVVVGGDIGQGQGLIDGGGRRGDQVQIPRRGI